MKSKVGLADTLSKICCCLVFAILNVTNSMTDDVVDLTWVVVKNRNNMLYIYLRMWCTWVESTIARHVLLSVEDNKLKKVSLEIVKLPIAVIFSCQQLYREANIAKQ